MSQPSIVFIHGLFQNPASWAEWQHWFEQQGYTTTAPAYPYHQGHPAELRAHPNNQLGRLTFRQVLNYLASHLKQLPEPPILIGHSIGGLLVQKLLELKLAKAAVAIDPAPPAGLFSFSRTFLAYNLSTVNPLKGNQICLPSVHWFHKAFCNTMTLQEATQVYEQYVVPESRNIPRTTLWGYGRIRFNQPHAPLLIIGGEQDTLVPSGLNRKNYLAYKDKQSITQFKVFAGRSHYICGQPGWEEVATYIHRWLKQLPA